MALFDVVRKAVQVTASKILESFKCDVSFAAYIGNDGSGTDLYATAIPVRAIVDPDKKERMTGSGSLVMTYAVLTFLNPIADTTPMTGFTREQPVDPRDVFVLPDGGTAPVVEAKGFMDPKTSRGVYGEVVLGSIVRGQ